MCRPTRRPATTRRGSCSSGSRRVRRPMPRSSSGDFNAEPDEPAVARMRRSRLPLGVRGGERRRSGGHVAVGLEAPAMDTDGDPGCLDYIWVRGAIRGRVVPAGVRSGGRRGSDPLPVGPPRIDAPALDRAPRPRRRLIGVRTLRLAHRGDWRHAPENTLEASSRRWPCPAATAWSSTSGPPVMAWQCATTMTR